MWQRLTRAASASASGGLRQQRHRLPARRQRPGTRRRR
jgi:hypothetical protein